MIKGDQIFEIVLPVGEIQSVNLFDPKVYKKFEELADG
jgi:hypothetical protein